jgi:beta-lactamase regulating signal transducer with metallopeptidase domain
MSAFNPESVGAVALSTAIKATALVAIAAAAGAVLRRRASAATRHLVWTLTIAAMLVLPVLELAVPAWEIPVPGIARVTIEPALHSPVVDQAIAVNAAPSAPAAAVANTPAAPTEVVNASRVQPSVVLLSIYAAGVLLMVIAFVIQEAAVRRFAASTDAVTDRDWLDRLAECRRGMSVQSPVALRRSRVQSVPVTFGIRRSTIVIPAIADSWDDDRRTAVMLHELAHIARRDCLTQAMARAACAVYWFHPGAWWIARRLRVERELACDDRVIAAGSPPREYAGHLLEIAYSLSGDRAPALVVSMARPRQLEGRVLAALDGGTNRRVPAFRAWMTSGAIAASLLVPLAAARPAPTAANVPAPENGRSSENAAGQNPQPGTWEIRPATADGTVHLRLFEQNSQTGTNVRIDQLEGLTAGQLTGNGGPVTFRIRRDAGTFTFEGIIRNGVGAGTFSFAPDPKFPAEMARRGFAQPTSAEQYELARYDVGYAFIDELTRQGYTKPSTSELVRTGQHGVHLTYLREMGGLGYRLGDIASLITLRDHGVTATYVSELAAAGYKGLTADQVRNARDHGATIEYMRALRDAGYGSLPLDTLINARDHGVTPEFIRALDEAGFKKLPLEQVVTARDHGVTPEYMRDMRQLGYQLQLDDLIRARDHGVTIEYVKEMAALGYSGQSIDALIRLRDHGVTVEYVRELKSLGYDQLPAEDLVTLRDHGLTSERIRSANSRAGTRLPIDLLKSLVGR